MSFVFDMNKIFKFQKTTKNCTVTQQYIPCIHLHNVKVFWIGSFVITKPWHFKDAVALCKIARITFNYLYYNSLKVGKRCSKLQMLALVPDIVDTMIKITKVLSNRKSWCWYRYWLHFFNNWDFAISRDIWNLLSSLKIDRSDSSIIIVLINLVIFAIFRN